MFALTDQLPWEANINGESYKVDLAFDNVLRIIDLLNDECVSDVEQILTGLYLLLGDVQLKYEIDELAAIFFKLFEEFIDAGEKEDDVEYDIAGNPMPKVKNEEDDDDVDIYDLKQDAQYIYASFMQTYRINLFEMQGKLHWYEFRALLSGLPDDTIFKQVISIRAAELPTGKGTSKERERMKKLKKAYALKGNQ